LFSVQIWTYKRTFFIRFLILKTMATIKLALLRHTQAKDGTYKIRIAVGHKNTTHYIITKYNGSVGKRGQS